jgi:hypothetical protein
MGVALKLGARYGSEASALIFLHSASMTRALNRTWYSSSSRAVAG